MTINPQQTTAPIGELGTRRVDRPVSVEPRRTRTAAPPSALAADVVAELADSKSTQSEAAAKALEVPEFPLQELSIRHDAEIGRVVVQVRDSQTGEVVRQIPSEEWVRVLKRLHGAKGLFVDKKG
jgi:flagellar protein FlaG